MQNDLYFDKLFTMHKYESFFFIIICKKMFQSSVEMQDKETE